MLVILIDRYLLPPGACSICGNAAGRAIDTLKEIDEFYRLFVCEQCVRHMAGMIGLVDEQQVKDAHEARDAAIKTLASESQKLDAARETVRLMQVAGFTDTPLDMTAGGGRELSGEVHVCVQCGFTAGTARALGQHKRIHTAQEVKV